MMITPHDDSSYIAFNVGVDKGVSLMTMMKFLLSFNATEASLAVKLSEIWK